MFDFLKKREYVELEPRGMGKRNKILIVVIIAAIVILAFGGTGGNKTSTEKTQKTASNEYLTEQYIAENEKRLDEILSTVQGAGKVKTMITVESAGEKVIAVDKKSESNQQNDNEKSSKTAKQEQTAILYGSGSEEKPFVVKEKPPLPSGVLVVATGAGDESVRLEIYEAVKALYGISGHRIKIAKGSIK